MDDCKDERKPEEWRSVIGYEGWYKVSSHGRVKRVRGGSGTQPGRILNPIYRQHCLTVALSRNAEEIIFRVHALVMAAFVGPRPAGLVINHIDGNTRHNAVENLEYVTQGENVRHAVRIGLKKLVGKHCKLNPDQVREIRKLLGTMTRKTIADKFGVSDGAIEKIAWGHTWKRVD